MLLTDEDWVEIAGLLNCANSQQLEESDWKYMEYVRNNQNGGEVLFHFMKLATNLKYGKYPSDFEYYIIQSLDIGDSSIDLRMAKRLGDKNFYKYNNQLWIRERATNRSALAVVKWLFSIRNRLDRFDRESVAIAMKHWIIAIRLGHLGVNHSS